MSQNLSFLKIVSLIWKKIFGKSQSKSFSKARGNRKFTRSATSEFLQQSCSLKVEWQLSSQVVV